MNDTIQLMKKYTSIQDLTTSEWVKMALIGILVGIIPRDDIGLAWVVILDIAVLLGFLSLIVWIYRIIKEHKNKKVTKYNG